MFKKYYTQITLFLIVLVLTTVSILTYRNLNNYIEEVKQFRHSNRVLQVLEEVFSIVKDAETGHRGYQLTRDTLFLTPYTLAVESIVSKINTLDSLVSENPQQRQRVDTLQSRINYQFLIISRILANTANSSLYLDTYEKNLLLEGKRNMEEIRRFVKEIQEAQAQISLSRAQKEATFREIAPFAILIYSLLAIGASVILFYRTLTALQKKMNAELLLLENNKSLKEEIALRQFTQSLLSNILNNSLSGIMAYKAVRENGKIVDFEWILANQESVKLTGKEEVDLIGKSLLKEMPSTIEDGVFDRYVDLVETGDPLITERLFSDPNFYKWFHVEAVKLEDGFVATFSDITERKNKDKQLRLINEDLRRSNEDLEQFAYVASHDLQEPLRKIRAFGDLLTREYKDVDGAHDYIHRMQNAASRMQVLIQDLLSFSRASRGTSQFENLNLTYIITEVLDDLENQITREHATISVRDIDQSILGDKVQIKRLFQNLISNAIKFHKTDVLPKVTVSVKILSEDKIKNQYPDLVSANYLMITIEDNGIGFNNQYAAKIFNIFQRLHGRLEYEGTGIGLAICRKIVSNHRGYILAVSEEQVGSKFIVILPREINHSS